MPTWWWSAPGRRVPARRSRRPAPAPGCWCSTGSTEALSARTGIDSDGLRASAAGMRPPYSLIDLGVRPRLAYPAQMLTLGGLRVDQETGAVLRAKAVPCRGCTPPDNASSAGFVLGDAMSKPSDVAGLDAVRQRLDAHGVGNKEGTAEERADRRVDELISFQDPSGNTLEVFHGAALRHRRAVSPYGHRFVTGEQGLGHVVLSTQTPGGFDVEFGCEGRTVSDETWIAARESTAVSLWGHDFSIGARR